MAVSGSARQSAPLSPSHPWLAGILFALDYYLRQHYAVRDFSFDPNCIFRLNIARANRALVMRDGTRLHPGDRIGRLHFWNEHIPPAPESGATIGWARQMQRRIAISLHELASYLASQPDLDDIAVICGNAPSATNAQSEQLARIMARYGFETIAERGPHAIGQRIRRLGENILISLIVFAQNAKALRVDSLSRVRVPIYISRRTLHERFGDAREP
jgi:hypothetical protein